MNRADAGEGRGLGESESVGFVLAGGQSSRMGADKALVQLAGQPLIHHALSTLREAGLPASIAGGSTALQAFASLVQDSVTGLGPLGGICTALRATSARLVAFLPVDLPLLPPSLIGILLNHARTTDRPMTLTSVKGFTQTFPVVLGRAVLPELEKSLKAGHGGCLSAFEAAAAKLGEPMSLLSVEGLVQSGQASHPLGLPAARWFLNVNSLDGLLQAEEYLLDSIRVSCFHGHV